MRNPIFDLLRIILIFLVVNVHIRIITGVNPNFLEPYTWYTVPLFVVLSFFFTSNKNLGIRIKRLILPLIFWSSVGFAIHPNLLNLKNISLQLFTGHVVDTPLYYLILLIWFTIINWLISRFTTRFKILVYLLIILVAFFLEYSTINFNFFSSLITVVEKSYGRFVELVKYVPVGLVFSYLIKKIKKQETFLFLSLIFLALFIIVSKIAQPPDFHYSGLKIFTGTIAIFSLVLWSIQTKLSKTFSQFIISIGEYSFGVYLSHYLLLELLLKIAPNIKSFISSQQILFLVIYTISVYIFCSLFDHIFRQRLSFLVK